MTALLIENIKALRPREGYVGSSLLIEAGRITAIDPTDVGEGVARFDGGARLLTPGLIDIHTHGLGEHLFETSPDAMRSALADLPRFGVTTVLPTLYRVMDRASLGALAELAEALDDIDAVRVPGFHLEGPFLARPGAGAQTLQGDEQLLRALIEACQGKLAAMSVSPDTPNVQPVIEHLAAQDIAIFLTHTAADVAQTITAIEAGARHATHFYDVFHLPGPADAGIRPVGAVEAILADERLSVDFIADGVHVDPVAIRMAVRCKGVNRTLLITDALIGAGMDEGFYDTPWGYTVRISPGQAACMHEPGSPRDGTLAGSALTMNVGLSNLMRWLDVPRHDVWSMASRSVAERMGYDDLGDLRVGALADLVLWDIDSQGNFNARHTWVHGRSVYDNTERTT